MNSDERWTIALEKAETTGELGEIIKMLRGDYPLTPDIRNMLADLIMYFRFKPPPDDRPLIMAADDYRRQKREGESKDQRIARVALANRVDEEVFRHFLAGRSRASARVRRMPLPTDER